MTDCVTIRSDTLTAEINLMGAELWRLADEAGREILWNGDPAFWTGRAPILFPCVGASRGETVRIDGVAYPMDRHGFARHQMFRIADQTESHVRLRLEATEATRRHWPFAFRLDMVFEIAGATLHMVAEVSNLDARPMPASFGWHPAFRWPLPYGGARGEHLMRFEADEPALLRSIDKAGLVLPGPRVSPLEGRDLKLADDLFVDDALVWDDLASRRILYGAPGKRGLDVTFPDMPWLGIWTKPGAGYVCIEPWAGHADFADFAGEAKEKPGMHLFQPGERKSYHMSVAVTEGAVMA